MDYPLNEENLGVCTKYNKCMQTTNGNKPLYMKQQDSDDETSFSFPDLIMQEERPI